MSMTLERGKLNDLMFNIIKQWWAEIFISLEGSSETRHIMSFDQSIILGSSYVVRKLTVSQKISGFPKMIHIVLKSSNLIRPCCLMMWRLQTLFHRERLTRNNVTTLVTLKEHHYVGVMG